MRIWILVVLAYLPCVTYATTVLKCIDAQGNVNFTQTACPPGQHLDSISELTAPPPPSGDGDPVKLAEPKAPTPVTDAAPAPAQPPIVIVAPTPAPATEVQGVISESYRSYQRHVPYRHDYYPPPPGHWGKPPGSWPPPPPPRPPVKPDEPRIKGMPMDR